MLVRPHLGSTRVHVATKVWGLLCAQQDCYEQDPRKTLSTLLKECNSFEFELVLSWEQTKKLSKLILSMSLELE